MSLKDIRSECTDVAGLLQPYVDGELSDDESKQVSEHLDGCEPCMAAVSEQLWVRSTLRALETEPAPQALRASILLGLDEVDREQPQQTPVTEPSWWSRVTTRVRWMMRGGLIMVPAATAAGVLFIVARGGFEDATPMPGTGLASALHASELAADRPAPARKSERDVSRTLSELEPKVGFPVQVVPDSSPRIQLVGARIDDHAGGAAHAAARLRYRVLHEGQETGRHVIDRQQPVAEGEDPAGTPVTFRGRRYLLGKGTAGEPVVHFQRSGVAHAVSLEDGPDDRDPQVDGTNPDFSHLLDLAHQLAQGTR